MVEMGLLDKKMKHYCIIQNVSLDEIAKKIGTHGKAEKQKARHRMERIAQSMRINSGVRTFKKVKSNRRAADKESAWRAWHVVAYFSLA